MKLVKFIFNVSEDNIVLTLSKLHGARWPEHTTEEKFYGGIKILINVASWSGSKSFQMLTRSRRRSTLQLFLESLHLFLQLPKQSIFGILVDASPVLYVLGSVRVPQCAYRLIVVVVGGSEIRHLASTTTRTNQQMLLSWCLTSLFSTSIWPYHRRKVRGGELFLPSIGGPAIY